MFQTPTFLPQSHIHQDPSLYQQPSAKFADLKRQTALISPTFLPLILAACGAGSGGGGHTGPASIAVSFAEADLSVRPSPLPQLMTPALLDASAQAMIVCCKISSSIMKRMGRRY